MRIHSTQQPVPTWRTRRQGHLSRRHSGMTVLVDTKVVSERHRRIWTHPSAAAQASFQSLRIDLPDLRA